MKKILVLVIAIIMTQFIACKPSKTTADKNVKEVETQAKTVADKDVKEVETEAKTKKNKLSIKEKMQSTKTLYEFGCRNEKDIYTFMEITESNWNIIRESKSFTAEELNAILNTPANKYFGIIGLALRFAYEMKDYTPEDLYKASINTLKTWFNSEDPNKWTLPDAFN